MCAAAAMPKNAGVVPRTGMVRTRKFGTICSCMRLQPSKWSLLIMPAATSRLLAALPCSALPHHMRLCPSTCALRSGASPHRLDVGCPFPRSDQPAQPVGNGMR